MVLRYALFPIRRLRILFLFIVILFFIILFLVILIVVLVLVFLFVFVVLAIGALVVNLTVQVERPQHDHPGHEPRAVAYQKLLHRSRGQFHQRTLRHWKAAAHGHLSQPAQMVSCFFETTIFGIS